MKPFDFGDAIYDISYWSIFAHWSFLTNTHHGERWPIFEKTAFWDGKFWNFKAIFEIFDEITFLSRRYLS